MSVPLSIPKEIAGITVPAAEPTHNYPWGDLLQVTEWVGHDDVDGAQTWQYHGEGALPVSVSDTTPSLGPLEMLCDGTQYPGMSAALAQLGYQMRSTERAHILTLPSGANLVRRAGALMLEGSVLQLTEGGWPSGLELASLIASGELPLAVHKPGQAEARPSLADEIHDIRNHGIPLFLVSRSPFLSRALRAEASRIQRDLQAAGAKRRRPDLSSAKVAKYERALRAAIDKADNFGGAFDNILSADVWSAILTGSRDPYIEVDVKNLFPRHRPSRIFKAMIQAATDW